MKRFRLLKQTRQSTEYSCGACALQSVMSYWGKDVDEAELMQLLGTTPEEGTWPEEMVRVARSQGLEAELKAGAFTLAPAWKTRFWRPFAEDSARVYVPQAEAMATMTRPWWLAPAGPDTR